jgi:uncharacterized protein
MLHKFIINGTRVVLDVHSGAVHRVDQVTWDILDDYQKLSGDVLTAKLAALYPRQEIEDALAEVAELVREGLLFSPDPLGGSYNPPDRNVVKALCLHLAHDCNLACRYCFAGQGKYGGGSGLMSSGVGKAALDLLIASSGSRRHVEVDFFGGEPLLNKKVLYELVDYGRRRGAESGKAIKFTLTTNALLLDAEMERFLNENISNVVLSLDGRPEVHDAMRPFPGGGGSYKTISANIMRFLESRGLREYYVRGTYTRANPDFSRDVLHLAEMGIKEISVEPVVAGPGEDYAITGEQIPVLLEEYERLAEIVLELARAGRPVNFYHFNIDLEGGPCLLKRMSGCGAGNEYLAVDPQGSLYPCHQFVGQEEYLLGDVYGGVKNKAIPAVFAKAHIYNKEGCPDCWAKFLCSGGCHASARAYSGSILKPGPLSCILMKKRLECALYLKAATADI